jgi:NADPH:quinone reductase-like Zn-dependent oxidoreductase
VTITGNQLMSATGIKAGQTVMVVGAAGNVGRSAVFTAKQRGATAIAGVLKGQIDEAKTVGADQVAPTDDAAAIANLSLLDAIADTVGGRTAEKLIAKVKAGGVYASVVEVPKSRILTRPSLGQGEILRFQVAMDDALLVRRRQTARDLHSVIYRVAQRDRSAPEPLALPARSGAADPGRGRMTRGESSARPRAPAGCRGRDRPLPCLPRR